MNRVMIENRNDRQISSKYDLSKIDNIIHGKVKDFWTPTEVFERGIDINAESIRITFMDGQTATFVGEEYVCIYC